jgi:hypothetical protein
MFSHWILKWFGSEAIYIELCTCTKRKMINGRKIRKRGNVVSRRRTPDVGRGMKKGEISSGKEINREKVDTDHKPMCGRFVILFDWFRSMNGVLCLTI